VMDDEEAAVFLTTGAKVAQRVSAGDKEPSEGKENEGNGEEPIRISRVDLDGAARRKSP